MSLGAWPPDPAAAPASVEGVGASHVQLPPGSWATVLDFLCDRFPAVDRTQWLSRMARGRVLDARGGPLEPASAYRVGATLHYFREQAGEPEIAGRIHQIYRDDHLLVVDKPPFLPVTPSGPYVQQTLLARLRRMHGLENLVPLHRLDRLTSGLVMLSLQASTRGQYQALFAQRVIGKVYEAIAPSLPQMRFPLQRHSRLRPGEPFFRMCEVPGEPDSLTTLECLEVRGELARYRLHPLTGRKHQLRVHLAALGAPILHDPLYPHLQPEGADDQQRPLLLVATGLSFNDPLSGQPHHFHSRRQLRLAPFCDDPPGVYGLLHDGADAGSSEPESRDPAPPP